MYALVINDQIINVTPNLPSGARDLETGAWITPPNGQWTTELAASVGYIPVVQEPRPADTETLVHYRLPTELIDGVPTDRWVSRERTQEELDAQAHVEQLEQLRENIVTQAIAWLQADAEDAQVRADNIEAAVIQVQTRRTQANEFTFNGSTVAGINTQLKNGLKPLLVDMLAYIIGIGQILEGVETWRGTRADPALIWLARHQTNTTD